MRQGGSEKEEEERRGIEKVRKKPREGERKEEE